MDLMIFGVDTVMFASLLFKSLSCLPYPAKCHLIAAAITWEHHHQTPHRQLSNELPWAVCETDTFTFSDLIKELSHAFSDGFIIRMYWIWEVFLLWSESFHDTREKGIWEGKIDNTKPQNW